MDGAVSNADLSSGRGAQPAGGAPTVGGCLVRVLMLSAALAAVEAVWLQTHRGLLTAGLLVALGLVVAASVVRWPAWWWRALSGTRLAAALLLLLVLSCVAGTLFVQDRDLALAGGRRERLDEFARRQGGFLLRLFGRRPRVELGADEKACFSALAARFGERYARHRRKDYLAARRREAREKALQQWLGRNALLMYLLHEFLWTVRLSDVFASWWFAGLLFLLGLNAFVCTARRFVGGWHRLGLAGIHLGVVTVLAGAALGRVTREEGQVFLDGRLPADRYLRLADARVVPLPFSISLADARTDYRRDLVLSFPGPGGRRLYRAWRVEPGGSIRLGSATGAPAYTITVEKFLPRSWPAGTVEELPATRPRRPAVEVRVERAGRPPALHLLPAGGDRYVTSPDGACGIRFLFASTSAGYEALALGRAGVGTSRPAGGPPPPRERYTVLACEGRPIVMCASVGNRPPVTLPLRPGEPVAVPGTRTVVTLLRFIDYAVFPLVADGKTAGVEGASKAGKGAAERAPRLEPRGQPGVRLRIEGPAGRDLVWLRANTPGWYAVDIDDELRVEYRDNLEAPPLRYRALVLIREDDHPPRRAVVEVNRPLKYRGYRFYQEDPEYRYLLVVRDPSLPVVYSGLLLLLAGTAVHFLVVVPVLHSRRAGHQRGEVAADRTAPGVPSAAPEAGPGEVLEEG